MNKLRNHSGRPSKWLFAAHTVSTQATPLDTRAKTVIASNRQPGEFDGGRRYASSVPGLFVRPSWVGSVG
jgi:hypothetical protein